ncbi:DivIVA domain-containing protein [Mycolicibacterium komossense]|uniref:DivIVA domain-containing protein n=1 Tax=Mycolicibacterium komossense TaxID=1779 RepID=A0ABT3CK63_9MYCO|nr:DivIVA domain-containing protein [Mycolicibacterium komossense]MCV7229890.1 DivIVA domain-containing protein [Mycolicibacterium komossense]
MTLVLLYLVVLVLVAVVLFGVGSLLFGRGERLPPLPRATTATVLPASGVVGADVEAVKFTQVLRGYKTSEVDWVLDRLGQELDSLRGELAMLRGDEPGDAPQQPADDPHEGAHALHAEAGGEPGQ